MKSSKFGLILLIVLAWLIIAERASAEPAATVKHDIRLNQIGYVSGLLSVNITNRGSDQINLTGLQISYPRGFSDIVGASIINPPKATVSLRSANNASTIDVSFQEGMALSGGATGKVEIHLSYGMLLKPLSKKNYTILLPVIPMVNVPVTKAEVSFEAPDEIRTIQGFDDFKMESAGGKLSLWRKGIQDVRPEASARKLVLELKSEKPSLNPVNFSEAMREIVAEATGEILVRDQITFVNLGVGEISDIPLRMLNEKSFRAILVPTGEPPLVNPRTINVFSGILVLGDASNPYLHKIPPNERARVTIEYPLEKKYIGKKESGMTITVPLGSPVDAIVENLSVRAVLPEGYVYLSEQRETVVGRVSPLDTRQLKLDFRPGVGWATQGAAPLAILIFIAAFAGLGIHSAMEKGRVPGTESKISELAALYEEKTHLTEEALQILFGRSPDRVSKPDVDRAKNLIDEVRGRTSASINNLKLQFPSNQEGQRILAEIARLSREYDRTAREIVDVYESYSMKRTRKERFDPRINELRKMKERLSATLVEKLNVLTTQ